MTVYALDAWCADHQASTTEVYDTLEKAVKARRRYFQRHPVCIEAFATVVKRRVR